MEKNKILKIVSMMLVVCLLGYTQIGCQSKEYESSNSQIKKEDIYKEDNENTFNENGDSVNTQVSILESETSNAQIHFINTGNSDAILIIKDNKEDKEMWTKELQYSREVNAKLLASNELLAKEISTKLDQLLEKVGE